MNRAGLIKYLQEMSRSTDTARALVGTMLLDRMNWNTPFGRVIWDLLVAAEQGTFR